VKSFPWGSKIHGFVNRQALPIGLFSLPPSQKISGRDRFGFTRIVRPETEKCPEMVLAALSITTSPGRTF
jgi:hypothetical protein